MKTTYVGIDINLIEIACWHVYTIDNTILVYKAHV